jgi:hypothetical protein
MHATVLHCCYVCAYEREHGRSERNACTTQPLDSKQSHAGATRLRCIKRHERFQASRRSGYADISITHVVRPTV